MGATQLNSWEQDDIKPGDTFNSGDTSNFEVQVRNDQNTKLTLFYKGIFSNFHKAAFKDKLPGIECEKWSNVEQYMHACKASLFGDKATLEEIIKTGEDPRRAKQLGRQVKPYKDEQWAVVARAVVTRGCWLKFTQNPYLLDELRKTGNNQMVECAPNDTRWGIGIAYNDPAATDRAKWRGSNWLGECLNLARDHCKAGTAPPPPDLGSHN